MFLGSILSLPYIFIFFASWLLASLLRPFIVVSLACVLTNPSAALRKGQLAVSTVIYLVFCHDKTWKKPPDPASYFQDDNKTKSESKTVIFVRHGESAWNETFNKGDRSLSKFVLGFLPNLVTAVATEWYFWCAGLSNESWFFDSPLSEKGRRQAESVQSVLKTNLDYVTPKEAALIRLLLTSDESQLVSSNLRRAIATMAIGFQDRLLTKGRDDDKILVLPALQEISRNPDALSITPAHGPVVQAWTDPQVVAELYGSNAVDTTLHTGNKAVTSNGLLRMQEFCHLAFSSDIVTKPNIIVGGHSLWFRSFFQTFLPYTVDHVAKKKKITNGGVVAFTLQRIKMSSDDNDKTSEGRYHYMIDPTSIVVLHGGF